MYKSQNLRNKRVSLVNQFYAITVTCKDRKSYFNSFSICAEAAKTIMACEKERLFKVIAFVLMPDHLHLIIQLNGSLSLSDAIRAVKGRITTRLRSFGVFSLWQKGYYEHLIRSEDDLKEQARYIIQNPIRANLVTRVCEYPYWFCIWV
ncbi:MULTISPECIES: REP-associated tyrosine transposase [Pseudoalteromonas]|uniref:REP-associated tyrosine transposase n=1 Tax=Pseudoalteromonas TaxID=53246 RepID=UPI00029A57F8|nr:MULTISPECIES: transposase [Pseudoalteromonas]MCF2825885.1 transposase [Pseudoalteromonas sp. OF5H-5]MCF2834164.1 transposase [Pseudoalteromonas sp. DL2-H6]MCF2925456.1 transposase [Pseudoalteromonas sp. DL2-H1]MCG7555137.1 transposase [Pseudoalteromonas sp. Of11M-6]